MMRHLEKKSVLDTILMSNSVWFMVFLLFVVPFVQSGWYRQSLAEDYQYRIEQHMQVYYEDIVDTLHQGHTIPMSDSRVVAMTTLYMETCKRSWCDPREIIYRAEREAGNRSLSW